jgi:predicted phage terminase large subunit-like protein
VCTTWGLAESGYYLLSLWRDRVEFPELRRTLIRLADEWNPNVILVEDRASGQSLLQELKSATRLPVIPVKVDSDKLSRAQAVTPLVESGRVFLPEKAPWLDEYIEEMAAYPTGVHDDAVDSNEPGTESFSQASGASRFVPLRGESHKRRGARQGRALGESQAWLSANRRGDRQALRAMPALGSAVALRSINGYYSSLFTLLVTSGLRAGEILGLRVVDLDSANNMIFVRQAVWNDRIPAAKRNVTEPDERCYALLMVLEFASQTATVLLKYE